jgi:hypothetical protein
MLFLVIVAFLLYEPISFELYLNNEFSGNAKKFSNKVMEGKVTYYVNNYFTEQDLAPLWNLLFSKHYFYPTNYLSFNQRRILVNKVFSLKPSTLEQASDQVNILKYGLGLNNASSTIPFSQTGNIMLKKNVCSSKFKINVTDSCEVSNYMDLFFFCENSLSSTETEMVEGATEGNCVTHCKEHCYNPAQVYVNQDCKSMFEKKLIDPNVNFHCIFLKWT